jgi:hypothetical protein
MSTAIPFIGSPEMKRLTRYDPFFFLFFPSFHKKKRMGFFFLDPFYALKLAAKVFQY